MMESLVRFIISSFNLCLLLAKNIKVTFNFKLDFNQFISLTSLKKKIVNLPRIEIKTLEPRIS